MASFKEILNGEQPVLVDFFATWCGPCQAMNPIVKELSGEFAEKVRILKVDIDKNQAAASQYQVRGVPTFILFRKGAVVWRASGAMAKSELTKALEKSLLA